MRSWDVAQDLAPLDARELMRAERQALVRLLEGLNDAVDTFMRALPRAYQDVSAPEGAEVSVVVLGAAGGRWTIRRGEDRWRLIPVGNSEPDAEARLPEDLAWRLLSGNVPVLDALAGIEIRGERTLAEPASRAVAIMTTNI